MCNPCQPSFEEMCNPCQSSCDLSCPASDTYCESQCCDEPCAEESCKCIDHCDDFCDPCKHQLPHKKVKILPNCIDMKSKVKANKRKIAG